MISAANNCAATKTVQAKSISLQGIIFHLKKKQRKQESGNGKDTLELECRDNQPAIRNEMSKLERCPRPTQFMETSLPSSTRRKY